MAVSIQKCVSVEIKAIESESHRVVAIVSTGKKDRDGEVILPDAWQLDYFRRGGVFLWAHASRSQDPQNVLGRVVGIEKTPAGLLATFEYDVDINPKAKMVFEQVKRGTLKAFSVGFLPTKWVTRSSPKDHIETLPDEARKSLESGDVFVVYTEAELVEISQVPIPSNPDALVGASFKSARLQELKQLEVTVEIKTEVNTEKAAAEMKPGPDIEAIVKAAVQPLVDQVAALTEQVTKLAASAPVEEPAAEDPAPAVKAAETIAKLAALPPAELVALMAEMSTEEREAVKGLLATAKT